MLEALKTAKKVVGAKQVRRAIQDRQAAEIFLADDADPFLTQPLEQQCRKEQIPITHVPAMKELGKACGIAVGSACAAIVR